MGLFENVIRDPLGLPFCLIHILIQSWFMKGIAADGVSKFKKDLLKLPDMERLVVRLKACKCISNL